MDGANAQTNVAAVSHLLNIGEEVIFMGIGFLPRTCEDAAQYSTQNDNLSPQNDHSRQIYGQNDHLAVNLTHG
jgi:hypothetical protein